MASPRRHRRHHWPARAWPRAACWFPRPAAAGPDSALYRDCRTAMDLARDLRLAGYTIAHCAAVPAPRVVTYQRAGEQYED